jgi:hypothetical protein
MHTAIIRQASRLVLALGAAMLSACAVLMPVPEGGKLAGQPQEAVRARFGAPTDVFQLRDGTSRWLYSKQPLGPQVYAADFDRHGNLIRFRNMLETPELYQAQVGTWTRQDVLEHFGKPAEPVQYYPLMKREAWSYRFRHEGLWPSLFNFYFDDGGVLRQTQITPDPLFDAGDKRF